MVSVNNTIAVQLLEIRGDPYDGKQEGDFRVIPSRIVNKGHQLVVDPVLLGSEGLEYQAPNNARGLPESSNSISANIRLALAVTGPLRIPGLRASSNQRLVGTNNAGDQSIIRDYRSANASDSDQHTSRGFSRDPLAPRIVGQLAMKLERVEVLSNELQVLTLYKAGLQHELDRGDVLLLFVDDSGVPAARTEIILDPIDDRGTPNVQHVQVQVRSAAGFAEHDPSRHPDFPSDPNLREDWLLLNAPNVIVAAEYNDAKDDAKYFVGFAPKPLPDPTVKFPEPNNHISPYAGIIIHFSKPIDLTTVSAFDNCILSTEPDATTVLDPRLGTPGLVAARVFDEDGGSQTALRVQTPFGFY
jgi:hypothetical protein